MTCACIVASAHSKRALENCHLNTHRKFNMDTKNGSHFQGNIFTASILDVHIEFAGCTRCVLTSWQIQHVHVMILF